MKDKCINRLYNIETPEQLARIPEIIDAAIPDDWCCISGKMHASKKLIEAKQVATHIILEMEGEEPAEKESKIGKCSPTICIENLYDRCPYNLSPSSSYAGTMTDVLSQEKLPCGLFLDRAGLFTGKGGIYYPKQVILAFAKKGYFIKWARVYQGFRQDVTNQTRELNPVTQYDYQYASAFIKLWQDEHVFGVHLQWNPKNGGSRKSLEEIVKNLKKIPIRGKPPHKH